MTAAIVSLQDQRHVRELRVLICEELGELEGWVDVLSDDDVRRFQRMLVDRRHRFERTYTDEVARRRAKAERELGGPVDYP